MFMKLLKTSNMDLLTKHDLPKECICPREDIYVDISIEIPDTEDLEEIDKDELTEDRFIPHNRIWKEISDYHDEERHQIEEYKLSKQPKCEVPLNPAVEFLEQNIFPLLLPLLEETLNKVKQLECIRHQKCTFNGIDFLAESLWNLNPRHPERKDKQTYIFDTDWTKEILKKNPRPFYPFSWIWSKDHAAAKIQAAIRGHWVRLLPNVQEMRQFWKAFAREKKI